MKFNSLEIYSLFEIIAIRSLSGDSFDFNDGSRSDEKH